MNSFLDLALRRRSIRKYQNKEIESEKIQTIIQSALASPSSKHLNPWEFVVVTDREILRRMACCRTYGSSMLSESPLGIVVCVNPSVADTWQCDGAIAALNMLLAAEDLGLGGCWVQVNGRTTETGNNTLPTETPASDYIRSLLDIPNNLQVLCIVSIGYKQEDKKPINPEKLQYEKVHYGKY